MKRFQLATRRPVLFGAFLVAALLVSLPMRLALDWLGLDASRFAARRVSGAVWLGSLAEAQMGDLPLGDLRARVSPFPLLIGRARVELARRGTDPAQPLSGGITITRHSAGLDDVTATLAAGRAFAPLPVTMLDLQAVSARFGDAGCERAEGMVRATLAGDIGGVPLSQALSGAARCEGGALLLPLAGAGGTQSVSVRLWPEGRYRAELTLGASDPAQAQQLAGAGFQQTPAGWRLSAEGRF
ncbi:type II secretion system protein N [Sphingomonas aracearum]|uniref:Type II secretion system protein N n=1 Tax=Sphingomonas aracearum TaxID=2283317 RepID=A0A369VUD5_9SPHN|nr:type II secretion system protein N [Sphingomonas aracearum]RDE05147.1 type II secretion system protein N [Sphingomonas aracearum]